MDLEFQEYRPAKIVNTYPHVDQWFWNRYSAHPYIGCASGCEFCYLRGGFYLGRRDPASFDSLIQVKTNAVKLLDKELSRLEKDVICCGDWQWQAEKKHRLSRGMLEVVLEHEFPLFVIERSPLLTRDLDMLMDINKKTWVGVAFSISSLEPAFKKAFEPRSPSVGQRLKAMKELAEAGIQVGTALMPVIPFAADDKKHLEDVIRVSVEHGAVFVLGGGLTMGGAQAERTLAAAEAYQLGLGDRLRAFFEPDSQGVPSAGDFTGHGTETGLVIRELCRKYGISDRMPRYIAPGPLAINKRIAEKLAHKTYELELTGADRHRVWAFRKAAWAVDEWQAPIDELYGSRKTEGLKEIPGIGKKLAGEISRWLLDDFKERSKKEKGASD